MASNSNTSRNRGNDAYRLSSTSGINEETALSHLRNALGWYEKAAKEATTDADKASAAKNSAKALWEYAAIHKAQNKVKDALSFYHRAFSQYNKAIILGKLSKVRAWYEDLTKTYADCVDAAIKTAEGTDDPVTEIHKFLEANTDEACQCKLSLGLTRALKQMAEIAMDRDDHVTALNLLKECQQPIHETIQISLQGSQAMTEAEGHRADVKYMLRKAEALQGLEHGIQLYANMITEEVDLNVDMMYQSIDCLQQAMIKSGEQHFEIEAKANYFLGKVFDTVFNNRERATTYYEKCLFWVEALGVETFQNKDWYRECKIALAKYQTKAQSKQDQAPIDLRAIRKTIPDNADFIQYIYSTFPPQNPLKMPGLEELKNMTPAQLKKFVPKMLLRYHPDKQKKGQDGYERWLNTCEEITKELNKIIQPR